MEMEITATLKIYCFLYKIDALKQFYPIFFARGSPFGFEK